VRQQKMTNNKQVSITVGLQVVLLLYMVIVETDGEIQCFSASGNHTEDFLFSSEDGRQVDTPCSDAGENRLSCALNYSLSSSNVFLWMPAGRWKLNQSIIISTGVRNVSIVGSCNGTIIECNGSAGIAVVNATDLSISHLSFEGCGMESSTLGGLVEDFVNFTGYNFSRDIPVSLLIAYSKNLTLNDLSFTGGRSLALMLMNPFGITLVHRLYFANISSGLRTHDCINPNISPENCTSGGVIVYYGEDGPAVIDSVYQSTLMVDDLVVQRLTTIHSVIKNDLINSVISPSLLNVSSEPKDWALSAGFSLVVERAQGPHLDVTLTNARFMRNRSPLAGCVYASFAEFSVTTSFNIHNSSFTMCEGGAAGGAIYMSFGMSSMPTEIDRHIDGNIIVTVSNCTFHDCVASWGAGIAVVGSVNLHHETTTESPPASVLVSSSNFTSNNASAGSAIALWNSKFHGSQRTFGVELMLSDDYFSENQRQVDPIPFSPSASPDTTLNGGVIYAESSIIQVMPFGKLLFQGNFVSSIVLIRSVLICDNANVTLQDNFAIEGAGLEMRSESFILDKNSTIVFEMNQALVRGGAVAQVISSSSPLRIVTPSCWVHFNNIEFLPYDLRTRVAEGFSGQIGLIRNVAGVTGSDLFSSVPPDCPWFLDSNFLTTSGAIRNGSFPIFTIEDADIPSLPNSSSPVGIGLGTINLLTSPPTQVMPGEQFTIALNVTDNLGFESPSVLGIGFANSNKFSGVRHTINGEELTHITGRNSSVNVRIFGKPNTTISYVVFTVESFTFSPNLTIVLTDCRVGFALNATINSCECDHRLFPQCVDPPVVCNINGTISVSSGMWIGLITVDNSSIFVVRPCIFDFCIPGSSPIKDITNETAQCANNRSGILCGQCQRNYSAVFGSNRCLQCESSFLFTIFGFAVVGLLLIFLLLCTHVTFTSGILGGIVFYSNIISVFSQRLFSASFNTDNPINNPNSNPIYILLSFISLNLGFEMCFYDGMNRLAVAGLQLVFPVYLFCIALTVIAVAHNFPKIPLPKSNILVEVLVTVVLLSYTAVLEAVTQMLGFVDVSKTMTVWLQDPNVVYGNGVHLFYVILATVIIIVFILPFPTVIILPNVFSRFKYFNKFQPFLYSLQVPFKLRWHRWEGIRILIRIMVLILANLTYVLYNDGTIADVFSIALLIVVITCQAYIQPYENAWLNVLDLFYVVNLILLLLVSLVLRNRIEILQALDQDVKSVQTATKVIYTTLMGSALLVFAVSIVVYLAVKFHWKEKIMSFSVPKKLCKIINNIKYRRRRASDAFGSCDDSDSFDLRRRSPTAVTQVSEWMLNDDSEDVQINKRDVSHLRESLLAVEMSDM
jgi:hypothetical protein